MIPWFIVNAIAAAARLVGRDVYVRAVSDSRFVERIYLMPRLPGAPARRLRPYQGGPLTAASSYENGSFRAPTETRVLRAPGFP